jgi:hypothetical protein
MSNVVPFDAAKAGEIMEQVLIRGDVASLTPAERARYYARICESLGLNVLTKPFDYIVLNGKLTLYALKGCTDQLRYIHGVSVSVVSHKEADGLLTVHVRARTADGREDEDFGVVSVPDTMKGDSRANAIMKAITKAKRRVTLSICGLGLLDESELETIPESAKRQASARPRTVMPAPKTRLLEKLSAAEEMDDELPGDLGPPKLDTSERDGVPAFLDRRKTNGAATPSSEATFVDLVGGADA